MVRCMYSPGVGEGRPSSAATLDSDIQRIDDISFKLDLARECVERPCEWGDCPLTRPETQM